MLIVDAGPLYAVAASKDQNHAQCGELLRSASRPLVVPELVITEVAYLLSDRIGPHAELAFGRSLASGELIAEAVIPSDWQRIVDLVAQYADLPLGIVDASVVCLAERLDVDRIATLDHRHFGTVRPSHIETFTLIP